MDLKASPWFSLEIHEQEWPWVFSKSRKPAVVISILEALAPLVALKLQFGEQPRTLQTKVSVAPTVTDNRGNGALLNKLMTTKYPASAVLMELAAYMKKMSLRTVVEWTPREGNREADKLANGQWDDFDEALRIPVAAADLVWEILPAALEMGRVAEEEYEGAKSGPGLLIVAGSRRGVSWRIVYVLLTRGEMRKIVISLLSGHRIHLLASLSFPLASSLYSALPFLRFSSF